MSQVVVGTFHREMQEGRAVKLIPKKKVTPDYLSEFNEISVDLPLNIHRTNYRTNKLATISTFPRSGLAGPVLFFKGAHVELGRI